MLRPLGAGRLPKRLLAIFAAKYNHVSAPGEAELVSREAAATGEALIDYRRFVLDLFPAALVVGCGGESDRAAAEAAGMGGVVEAVCRPPGLKVRTPAHTQQLF